MGTEISRVCFENFSGGNFGLKNTEISMAYLKV